MTSSLRELRERVEAASGGDRTIDGDIAEHLGLPPQGWKRSSRNTAWWNDVGGGPWQPPAYTSSIDAAVALVEKILPDSYWELDQGYNATITTENPVNCFVAASHTPALTLLCALLRALEAKEPQT
jgi:hypothetical protein